MKKFKNVSAKLELLSIACLQLGMHNSGVSASYSSEWKDSSGFLNCLL